MNHKLMYNPNKISQAPAPFAPAPGIEFTPTALIIRRRISFDEFSELFVVLCRAERAAGWWIGDLLNYGEEWLGEEWTQVLDEEFSPQTLYNYKYIAKRFPPPMRTIDLPFSFYAEVAALDDDAATQLLQDAQERNWSCRRLRAEVRAYTRGTIARSEPRAVPESDKHPLVALEVVDEIINLLTLSPAERENIDTVLERVDRARAVAMAWRDSQNKLMEVMNCGQ